MIDNDKMLKLIKGQGQKIKGPGQICNFVNHCLDHMSWTYDWIFMILTHLIYIDKMLKLTQGQGHKIKGQSQICKFVKNLV